MSLPPSADDADRRMPGETALLWICWTLFAGCLVALPFVVQQHYGLTPAILPAVGGFAAVFASAWQAVVEDKVRGWHAVAFLGGAVALAGSYVQGTEQRGWARGAHCIWDFMSEYREHDWVTASVHNPTEYPAYECSMGVRELVGKPGAWDLSDKPLFSWNAGTIPPGGGSYVEPLQLGSGDIRRFVVEVWTRSGFYFQRVYFRRINGHWLLASELDDHDGGGVIYRRIDPELPRVGDSIDWR